MLLPPAGALLLPLALDFCLALDCCHPLLHLGLQLAQLSSELLLAPAGATVQANARSTAARGSHVAAARKLAHQVASTLIVHG
jgi:hypothetical protein